MPEWMVKEYEKRLRAVFDMLSDEPMESRLTGALALYKEAYIDGYKHALRDEGVPEWNTHGALQEDQQLKKIS